MFGGQCAQSAADRRQIEQLHEITQSGRET